MYGAENTSVLWWAVMVIPIIDLHEDISAYFMLHGGGNPLGDLSLDIPKREADIPKYVRGNVRLVFASVFAGIETFKPIEYRIEERRSIWIPTLSYRAPLCNVMEHLVIYYKIAEYYPNLRIIESMRDVDEVINNEAWSLGLLLHLEGCDCIEDPYDLKLLRRLGIRSIGITWNYGNKYGAGCYSKKDYGLTDLGEELIKIANDVGVIVDLAHASQRTMLEAAEISKKPIIISHANVRRFVDSPRNAGNEVLEVLSRCGGVIGLSAISSLISSRPTKATIDDLINQYLYVYECFGPDILAIGTDFLGLLGIPPPKGFESIDRVQYLLEKLKERGLSGNDIEKIAYRNVLRVIKKYIVL